MVHFHEKEKEERMKQRKVFLDFVSEQGQARA